MPSGNTFDRRDHAASKPSVPYEHDYESLHRIRLLYFLCDNSIHRFGNVSFANLPAYLFNKAFAVSAAICFFFAASNHFKKNYEQQRFWGVLSFSCAFIHIFLSLSIFTKSYYPRFFGSDKLSLSGEFIVLFGVLAAFCFFLAYQIKQPEGKMQIIQTSASIAVGLHLIAMGLQGWMAVMYWNGGLPPISLIAFVFMMGGAYFYTRKQAT